MAIRNLFQTTWDPPILEVIAEEPCRFLALARRVRDAVDPGLVDANVTRSLSRLGDLGLIRKGTRTLGDRRVHVYELTSKGRGTLLTYNAIIEAYRVASGDLGSCSSAVAM